jgi:hypothetical protein
MRPEREEAADRVVTMLSGNLLKGWLRATLPGPGDSIDVIRQLAGSHALAMAMKEQLKEDLSSLTDEECEEVLARVKVHPADPQPGVIADAR